MYVANMEGSQVILTYSDVFSEPKPNLIEKIKTMNMHKTISIISELIQIIDLKYEYIKELKKKVPYETVLKVKYCGITSEHPKMLLKNGVMRNNRHIISLQMLLVLLKKVIIYGNYDSLKIKDYKISDEDYRDVIKLQLLVSEEISEKDEQNIDINHFVYSTYHLNYKRNVTNTFQRMYYIMECLCANPQLFDNIRTEYRNYYLDFTIKYGLTPTEYSSLLFFELGYYFSEKKALSHSSCWKNINLLCKDLKTKEKMSKVIDMLQIEPIDLRNWAENTETEEWNFTSFYRYPFLFDGENEYISISDITLINSFFENLFWLIRDCYPKKDSRSMAFFGRLFERYIQDSTKNACKDDYIFINEFSFFYNKTEQKSSDVYIRKDNNLLVVESKGFSVFIDCMAKNEKVEENNKKLFIKPVLQADKCLNEIIDKKEEFNSIEEVFIISVTLDNINAVPDYYNTIHKIIDENKQCELVHYYFNFSIEEYEILLFLIESGKDCFQILRNYFSENVLSPFITYVNKIIPKIGKTKFMEKNYNDAIAKMKSISFR